MPSVSRRFSHAVAQHRAGNYTQAEAICRETIAGDPHHSDALHLLGLIASDAGRHDAAAALVAAAIQIAGPLPAYCSSLGVILSRQGKIEQAIACYRQALKGTPGDGKTRFRLGQALLSLSRLEEAAVEFRASARFAPDSAETHFELGNTLHAIGRYEEAAQSYRRAIARKPDHAEASHNLGVTRTMQQRPAEAAAAYEYAIRVRPDYPEPHNNLATLLHGFRQEERAVYHYKKALQLAPRSIDIRYNLALLTQERERLEEAAESYAALLELKPDHTEARNNLGNTLLALGRPAEAISSYRRTLLDDPGSIHANWNLGVARLLLGQFEEGWKGHEWRLRQPGAAAREFPQPLWDGSALGGRRILLHAEQGLGDTLQFVRYAPLVRERGGFVILECQKALLRLLAGARGVDQLIGKGDSLPDFDCHAPLLSLPGILRTRLETIPGGAPYLYTGAAEIERWRKIIASRVGPKSCLKVGLTWAGNPLHSNDRNRSLGPQAFSALAGVGKAVYFGLQKDGAGSAGVETIDLLEPSTGFSDTAAILINLDLVISVDTAVAHLAGALGRPVWTLLPFAPDWRWMTGRADSPWYPTMKLFRQARRKDWAETLERVRRELDDLSLGRKR